MECPRCGCRHSHVVKSEPRTFEFRGKSRTIRQRRRECRHCGTRFTTREVSQSDRTAD